MANVGGGKPSAETDADTGTPSVSDPSAPDTAVGAVGVGETAPAAVGTTSATNETKATPQSRDKLQIFLIRELPSRAEVC